MTHILSSIPNPHDATSLYRGVGPLYSLQRVYPDIQVAVNPPVSWMTLKGADLAFFQRPAFDDRMDMIRMAKSNNVPIWLDYDDDLFSVPLCNPMFPLFAMPQVANNLANMLAMADLITVTTEVLKEKLAKILAAFPSNKYDIKANKIHIIPNGYDPDLLPSMERPPREKLVVWRGSASHVKDLWIHTEALTSVIKEFPDWKFEFIGETFWGTLEHLRKHCKPENIIRTGSMDPILFYKYLARQRPAVVIVPLEDIEFNRSKSNIAWLEATSAGAATLAPDWPEWNQPGIATYNGLHDFTVQLSALMIDSSYQAERWSTSKEYIQGNLQLSDLNKMRYTLIHSVKR